jgi:hypothetical protein
MKAFEKQARSLRLAILKSWVSSTEVARSLCSGRPGMISASKKVKLCSDLYT